MILFVWDMLDSTTFINSNDLSLNGYNLHRVGDPNNVKKGRVCVYYKETLAVQFLQAKFVLSVKPL